MTVLNSGHVTMGRPLKKDAYDTDPRDLGRYRLHGEIASGGMATVHFGRQVGTGGFAKTVAIKRLHPQFGKMPEFVEMFLSEARLAARIRHPNVVQPLDVLTVEDEVFLVMEYVEGDSLSRLLRATATRKERVPLNIAITIMCGVLHGLHAAHEAKNDKGEPLGIVHRDVSPQNILVGGDGVPRVIDFGIAKAADSVQITREGELKGKLSYMSPEQLNGGKVTRRIDIYAAAVVLWEVLTGQRLFDADYQSAILKNILHRPIDPPSDVVPELPRALDAIVMKGVAKDPSDRWATAREMALALEECLPLATPSTVGAWVELVAAQSIAKRSQRVAEIEALPPDASEPAEEIVSEMFVHEPGQGKAGDSTSTRTWKNQSGGSARDPGASLPDFSGSRALPTTQERAPAPPSQRARAPLPPDDPAGYLPRLGEVVPAPPRSAPSPREPPPPRRPTPLPPERVGSGLPPPTINVSDGPLVAPAWPVQGIAPAAPGTPVLEEAKKRSQGGGMLALLIVILGAVIAFYIVLPELVRRSYVSSAARDGITLTINQVDISLHEVHLHGVTAVAGEVPGVSMHAKSIDLTLHGFDPVAMSFTDAVLTLDGSYPMLHESISRWTMAHVKTDTSPNTLARVTIESGHVIWTRPFGETTRLEAETVTGDVERKDAPRVLGDDLELYSPLVSLTTTAGTVGPWRAKWARDGARSKATIDFDPTGQSGARASVLVYDGSVSSIDATLPRMGLPAVGFPLTLFGRHPEESLLGEGELQYGVRQATRDGVPQGLPAKGARVVDGRVRLALTGARLAGALVPVDVQIEGKVEGDSSQPLDVTNGAVVFGLFKARLDGKLTLTETYLKADLVWRSAPRPCGPGADAQVVTGTIKFDSRSLDDTQVTTVPNAKCGMRIFPL